MKNVPNPQQASAWRPPSLPSLDTVHGEPRRFAMLSVDLVDEASPTRLSRFLLQSAFLPTDREVTVYIPAAYADEPNRRFPVFYLHDGQNLFDPHSSYIPGHTWNAHATADRLAATGEIAPVILVGIANTGLQRMAEYTPTADPRSGGGLGQAYGRLLVEELKPFVDGHFRTQPEAAATGLGGSSLGGLISLFLGLRYPLIFGKLGVISPSIWWDRRSILDSVAGYNDAAHPSIWLDIGTAEGGRHVRDTDLLHRLLLKRGWQDDVDLRYRKFPNAVHSEDAWAERFNQVLTFLFPSNPSMFSW